MRRTAAAASMIASLVLCSGSAFAQQKSLKDQLVGIWNLTSWEQTYPDGHKDQAFGQSPKGLNTFDSNGRFSLIFLNPNVPMVASNDRVRPTSDEAMAIAKGVIAYYGTYTVDEGTKTIIPTVEGATFPNMVGTDQSRIVTSITADEMRFTNPKAPAGVLEIVWRRAK